MSNGESKEVAAVDSVSKQIAGKELPRELMELRAAVMAVRKTQWSGSLTDSEISAYEYKLNQSGLSLVCGDAYIFGGNVYVSLDGRIKNASLSQQFDGFSHEGPLPKDQWEAWGVRPDAEAAWICTVARKDMKNGFTEVGWAGGSREKDANQGRGQPVAKQFPAEMARKRARARALKLAFSLGFRSMEDAGVLDVEVEAVAPIVPEPLAPPKSRKKAMDMTPPAPAWSDLHMKFFNRFKDLAERVGQSHDQLHEIIGKMTVADDDGGEIIDVEGVEEELERIGKKAPIFEGAKP